MNKRKISAILAGLMIVAALPGCGKKSSNPIEAFQNNFNQYVTIENYKGIEYTKKEATVTDDQIEQQKSVLVSQNTVTNQIKDRAAKTGDTVNIDFAGSIDGTAFSGGTASGQDIEIGSGNFIPGFEEGLVGHKAGDTFDIELTFPASYTDAELAGQDAVFAITFNYIREDNIPTYGDALVASATDYKTTKEFEDAKRQELLDDAKKTIENNQKTEITEKLVNAAEVKSYPKQIIQEKVTYRLASLAQSVQQIKSSYNMTPEQYMAQLGYTPESFKNMLRDNILKDMQIRMIICKIAEEEKITVNQAEVDAYTNELVEQAGVQDKATLSSYYLYTDDDYWFLTLQDKVNDFLLENGKAVEASESDATQIGQ